MLTAIAALALALSCVARVAPEVLLLTAHAESHWNALAIHDNVTEEAFAPSRDAVKQIASSLVIGGHNPDPGIPQIIADSRNGSAVERIAKRGSTGLWSNHEQRVPTSILFEPREAAREAFRRAARAAL
jgi:type IV secretion system protein VirB1